MVIFRLAVQYKLIRKKTPRKDFGGRSFCDSCNRQLTWYENIPVVSWIVQRGKTRCCHKKLPVQYPLLEISMGIIFMLINFNFAYLLIATLLMFSLVFDLKYMILPDRANAGLIILSLILLIGKGDYLTYLLAGLGSTVFFFILNRIRIRGSEAMGMGDVKYALFMGLFLGYPKIIVAIYFAFVVGAIVSLGLLIFKIVKKENPIPFGPFLIIGTVVAGVWGDVLIKYFLSVFLN